MLKLVAFAPLLAACTTGSSPAMLSDLPSAKVSATNQSFGIDYDTSGGCYELAAQVTATVDGNAVALGRGGETTSNAFDGTNCIGMGFTFSIDAHEPVTSFVLADGQSTWNIEVANLAPDNWTAAAPATVTEGSDVAVGFSPALPDVAIADVTITPDGYVPFTQAATNNHVTITSGYWSGAGATHGSQLPGTIALDLGVPAKRCTGPASCSVVAATQTTRTTIVVP
jgi:hypothetical protein